MSRAGPFEVPPEKGAGVWQHSLNVAGQGRPVPDPEMVELLPPEEEVFDPEVCLSTAGLFGWVVGHGRPPPSVIALRRVGGLNFEGSRIDGTSRFIAYAPSHFSSGKGAVRYSACLACSLEVDCLGGTRKPEGFIIVT